MRRALLRHLPMLAVLACVLALAFLVALTPVVLAADAGSWSRP